LFVSSVLFVFWYHSPNFLDTPRRSLPHRGWQLKSNARYCSCLLFNMRTAIWMLAADSVVSLLHPDTSNVFCSCSNRRLTVILNCINLINIFIGPASSVRKATGYGLDCPGIEYQHTPRRHMMEQIPECAITVNTGLYQDCEWRNKEISDRVENTPISPLSMRVLIRNM
jgi:hypothetical protein